MTDESAMSAIICSDSYINRMKKNITIEIKMAPMAVKTLPSINDPITPDNSVITSNTLRNKYIIRAKLLDAG